MKTIYFIMILCLTLACGTEKEPGGYNTLCCIVVDRTDRMMRPDAAEIIALCGIDKDIWKSVKIIVSEITDVTSNTTKVFALEREEELNGNPEIRKGKVRKFKRQLIEYLNSIDTTTTKEYSLIYKTTSEILNYLASAKADNKIMVLHGSDCNENSTISFYSPETLKLLQTNPEVIQEKLEREKPLLDLTGIHVYFRFKTANFQQDTLYQITSSFFMKMYEKHHAVIHSGSALTD